MPNQQTTNANANANSDLWSTLNAMKVAPPGSSSGGGIIHLGDDGVLRTIDENNNKEVLAYKQLSPDEITQMLRAFFPFPGSERDRQRLTDLFRGVDGRMVTDEKDLWHPGADILPPLQEDDDELDFSRASLNNRQPMTEAEEALSKLRRDEEQVACYNFACRTATNCLERDYRCRKNNSSIQFSVRHDEHVKHNKHNPKDKNLTLEEKKKRESQSE
ncbi:hypothetical protein VTN00DRAFT_5302 [Thermoascus crustaceus]|uniref:uncharacterized protein n=1 Tax=Thermoascus crustaceus TaxID=5088 RepID=UPI0037439220